MESSAADGMETLAALLAATEGLAAALAAGEEEVDLAPATAAREAAFARFAGVLRDPTVREALLARSEARVRLDRIRALDAALLEAGRSELGRLARERVDLSGRRRGVQAHGERGRSAPRAVTIKA